MGYYSEVMIAVTKKDFKKVEDAQAKMTENLLDYVNKHDYKENNKDCVFMYWDSLKYYKEFEEVQALEKSLSKLKDGYVFCRLGEESGDIEFRKRTKIPELMKEFQFIRDIRKKLNEELKEEDHWKLKKGGNYYVTRNHSAIIAFSIPQKPVWKFHIMASHSDSPSLKIKENPEIEVENAYIKLNVERYGGMILSPWFDRPLSVAGGAIAFSNGKNKKKKEDNSQNL